VLYRFIEVIRATKLAIHILLIHLKKEKDKQLVKKEGLQKESEISNHHGR
jgi:hypothetical protein